MFVGVIMCIYVHIYMCMCMSMFNHKEWDWIRWPYRRNILSLLLLSVLSNILPSLKVAILGISHREVSVHEICVADRIPKLLLANLREGRYGRKKEGRKERKRKKWNKKETNKWMSCRVIISTYADSGNAKQIRVEKSEEGCIGKIKWCTRKTRRRYVWDPDNHLVSHQLIGSLLVYKSVNQ